MCLGIIASVQEIIQSLYRPTFFQTQINKSKTNRGIFCMAFCPDQIIQKNLLELIYALPHVFLYFQRHNRLCFQAQLALATYGDNHESRFKKVSCSASQSSESSQFGPFHQHFAFLFLFHEQFLTTDSLSCLKGQLIMPQKI